MNSSILSRIKTVLDRPISANPLAEINIRPEWTGDRQFAGRIWRFTLFKAGAMRWLAFKEAENLAI